VDLEHPLFEGDHGQGHVNGSCLPRFAEPRLCVVYVYVRVQGGVVLWL
jgi:hypothetical protein